LGYKTTWGDRNRAFYATSLGGTNNSDNGKPDSSAIISELDYLPWQNTKFSLQYTAYTKFNGSKNNYNGTGRDASDNNTLYLNGWIMF
jgi:hypothetical protein